jgi:hypothetical protein
MELVELLLQIMMTLKTLLPTVQLGMKDGRLYESRTRRAKGKKYYSGKVQQLIPKMGGDEPRLPFRWTCFVNVW